MIIKKVIIKIGNDYTDLKEFKKNQELIKFFRYGLDRIRIKKLQKRLNLLGACLYVDGVFGYKTEKAFKKFKKISDSIIGLTK